MKVQKHQALCHMTINGELILFADILYIEDVNDLPVGSAHVRVFNSDRGKMGAIGKLTYQKLMDKQIIKQLKNY